MSMKIVLAYLKPAKLDRVTLALERLEGFPGMTVSDARGFGREKLTDARNLRDQLTDFVEIVRLEAVVPDAMVEEVTRTIIESAHTGQGGDGLVSVLPIERATRIRTRGPAAEEE